MFKCECRIVLSHCQSALSQCHFIMSNSMVYIPVFFVYDQIPFCFAIYSINIKFCLIRRKHGRDTVFALMILHSSCHYKCIEIMVRKFSDQVGSINKNKSSYCASAFYHLHQIIQNSNKLN
jgi:hypothetical protein